MKIDEISEKDMKKVLNGNDILRKLPNEYGYYYVEKNWTRYSEKEKMLIRKWIRFMFNKSKNINKSVSSYGLKHYCEADVGFYVHNDTIKKAMLLEGFLAKTGEINWFFNISGNVNIKKSNKFKEIFKEEIKGGNKNEIC